MRRKLFLLLLILVALSVGFYRYVNRPQTIFDEIYQETKKTYRTNNVLGEIEAIDVSPSWPEDSEYISYSPSATYKLESIPKGYLNIVVAFDFGDSEKTSFIRFDKEIDSSVKLRVRARYSYADKKLKKIAKIILIKGGSDKHIESDSETKAYLDKYGITAKDLDTYYDEIVNQKVLTDWLSIYDSKYSPDDYGAVRIETAWEDW